MTKHFKNETTYSLVLAFCVFAFFSIAHVVWSLTSIFFILVITAIFFTVKQSLFDKQFFELKATSKEFIPLAYTIAALFLIAGALLMGRNSESELNFLIGFLLTPLIYNMVRHNGVNFNAIHLGLIAFVCIASVYNFHDYFIENKPRARGTIIVKTILTGNIFAIAAIYFLANLKLSDLRKNFRSNFLYLLLAFIALINVYLSGSKSPLLFLLIMAGFYFLYLKLWKKPKALGFIALALVVLVSLNTLDNKQVLAKRVSFAMNSLSSYLAGDLVAKESSTGLRFELWKAGWIIFKQSPIYGTSKPNVKLEMYHLADTGEIVNTARASLHLHTDIMDVGTQYGLLGLLFYFSVIGYMFKTFWSYRKRLTTQQKVLLTNYSTGIIIFGLTDSLFSQLFSHSLIFWGTPIIIASMKYHYEKL